MTKRLYRDYIKRFLDIVLSAGAIIVLSPVMAVTAVLVRIKLGSPVIFKQKRPGKDERIFEMYKFRSMTDARDENGELLPDEVRLTSFGKKLRASSLDEPVSYTHLYEKYSARRPGGKDGAAGRKGYRHGNMGILRIGSPVRNMQKRGRTGFPQSAGRDIWRISSGKGAGSRG